MIATDVASPFLTPFKLAFFASVFIAMPYILFQLWRFIAPALYAKERKLAIPMLLSSIILFYTGIAFAYFVVFPLVFGFLSSAGPEGVAVMTDISRYLDFVIKLFFAFGAAFEIAQKPKIWVGYEYYQNLQNQTTGELTQIGFETEEGFEETILVCFDRANARTFYAKHTLYKEILGRDTGNDRPSFAPAGYFDFDVNDAYSKVRNKGHKGHSERSCC